LTIPPHDLESRLLTGAASVWPDAARLESIVAAAGYVAKTNDLKMRLVKFTNRLEVEEITP
jgi:hypothetical protein